MLGVERVLTVVARAGLLRGESLPPHRASANTARAARCSAPGGYTAICVYLDVVEYALQLGELEKTPAQAQATVECAHVGDGGAVVSGELRDA